ncbi:MAG: SEC-C metal-binding domain-containing protein [Verrucomicrobiota bacterium]
MSKPGRNDPCPCGSGKKHKKIEALFAHNDQN